MTQVVNAILQRLQTSGLSPAAFFDALDNSIRTDRSQPLGKRFQAALAVEYAREEWARRVQAQFEEEVRRALG